MTQSDNLNSISLRASFKLYYNYNYKIIISIENRRESDITELVTVARRSVELA